MRLTEIERRIHGDRGAPASRILEVKGCAEPVVAGYFAELSVGGGCPPLWRSCFVAALSSSASLARQSSLVDARVTGALLRFTAVKGTASRRAALALDRPARRFRDGYKRMG